ncbi:MAG: RNA 2',3'-cyclic phosphodiesterase [Bryobacteraceae bacterium]
MRLFTAIELPPPLLIRLERLLSALRPEAQINWSPLDNLHMTTSFIGNWPEARLEELTNALSSLLPRDSFEVKLNDFCWFPNARSPHVLSIGTEPCVLLQQLGDETRNCLEQLGVPKEKRPYTPHLTLARVKRPVPLQRLRQKLESFQPSSLGDFEVHSFSLYRSDPGSNASVYRKLKDFHFETVLAAS